MNTIDNLFRKDALSYHAEGRPGKLEVIPSKPYNTKRDLSLAYTPGLPILVLKSRIIRMTFTNTL